VCEGREKEKRREIGKDVIIIEFAVRGVQVSEAKVHTGVRVRAVLSAGQSSEVRLRTQGFRRQQRGEAAQRAQCGAARRRR